MTKLAKKVKNNFAKVFKVPFLFAVLFVLAFLTSFVFEFKSVEVFADNSHVVESTKKYSDDYLKYLNLSSEEKSTYQTTPRMYEVDFDTLYTSTSYKTLSQSEETLPTEYVLYNLSLIINNFDEANKNNYENINQNLGNQKDTGICWAFASNTAFETTLYKSGLVPSGQTINFSELHLAYTSLVLNNGLETITGGTFDLAYEYYSREEGPVFEAEGEGYKFGNSMWGSDNDATNGYRDKYYSSAVHSGYSALETFTYPSRSSARSESERLDLRNSIKNHIKKYGAVTSSVYWEANSFYENKVYMYLGRRAQNHAITLVGWDDNYTLTSYDGVHTGAYIAQNSWGKNGSYYDGYFYIMYDDVNVEQNINGFVRVGKTDTTNVIKYNNNDGKDGFVDFVQNGNSSYIEYTVIPISDDFYFANIYKNLNIKNQYISRLKVPTAIVSDETNFYIYYADGLTENDVDIESDLTKTLKNKFSSARKIENKNAKGNDKYLFTSNQTGYYTIDVKEKLSITGEYFAFYIHVVDGEMMYRDNASTISQPYQFTYKSSGGDWSPYYVLSPIESNPNILQENTSVRCVLPMEVQTKYILGNIEYTATGFSGTYDSLEHNISVNVTNLTNYNYKISYSLTGKDNTWQTTNFKFKDVVNQTVYFKIEADYYKTVTGSKVVNINKKDVIVTPYSNQSKIYGDPDPIISYQTTGCYETPAFIERLSREAGEDVGFYKIVLGSLQFTSKGDFKANNYNLVFSSTPINFEITKRLLSVTPTKIQKIYGEEDPTELTFSYFNQVNSEIPLFSGSLLREVGNNVAKYDINLNDLAIIDNPSTGFKKDNYSLQIINNQDAFEILKRDLIVTPDDDQEKDYLGVDPTFTYTYSNAVSGETPLFTGVLTRESGEDSGIYQIKIGSLQIVDNGNFKSTNYNLVFDSNPVYFLITLGKLTGCSVQDVTTNYTGLNHYLNPICTDFQNVYFKYSVDNVSWQNEPIGYKDVGVYTVYVKFLQNNYSSTYGQATITINKTNLTVLPLLNQSKIYGEPEPTLNYTIEGVQANETPVFNGNLERVMGEDVGEYLISVGSLTLEDGNNFKSSNYNYIFDNSNQVKFAITQRSLIVTPKNNQTKTYGKNDNEYLFDFSNQASGESPLFTGALTRQIGENVGKYAFEKGTLNIADNNLFKASNYVLVFNTQPIYFEITKANIVISVNDVSAVYNGQDCITEFASVITGDYVSGDQLNITYYCSVDRKTKKGEYPIICSASNPNYDIQFENGVYTVTYEKFDVKFSVLGEIVYTTQVEHFSCVSVSEVPTVNEVGYNFKNWAITTLTPGVYLPANPTQDPIYGEIVYIAIMELEKYNIKYVLNKGTWQTEEVAQTIKKTYSYIDETFELDEPVRTGYTFIGWYKKPDFSGERLEEIKNGSTEDITLYAKWQINIYYATIPLESTDSYALTYKNELGIEYLGSFTFKVSLTKAYSQSQKTIKAFVKWQKTGVINELVLNKENNYVVKNIADNFEIILEGININVYTIKFIADDKEIKSVQKEHGQSLTELEYPVIPMQGKENFDDTAPYWDKTSLENIVKDEVVFAVYIPNVYVITFVMQDGKEFVTSVTYGDRVSEEVLREQYDLNMFEYFVYDSSLENVSSNTTINVKIETNIYILYIILASVVGLIMILVVIGIIKRKRRNKFNWWLYAGKEDIEKEKQ